MLEQAKRILIKNPLIKKVNAEFKKVRKEKRRLTKKYVFEDRRKKNRYACLILAGYKEELWDNVFTRITAYVPEDIDVCIVSSGVYSKRLSEIAQKNCWSYVSTKANKITLALNMAISLMSEAEYIYKLDEDMFITKEFFESVRNKYFQIENEEKYVISFAAPLIPVNTYGYVRLLEIFHREEEWQKKFGTITYSNGLDHHCEILKDPESARFMWGECREFQDIDLLSEKLAARSNAYSICPIRFSIGAIFFKRDYWNDMGMLDVSEGNNLGYDEYQMCTYGMDHGMVIAVDENCAVGHLAYGPQTKKMLEYYREHNERFVCKK